MSLRTSRESKPSRGTPPRVGASLPEFVLVATIMVFVVLGGLTASGSMKDKTLSGTVYDSSRWVSQKWSHLEYHWSPVESKDAKWAGWQLSSSQVTGLAVVGVALLLAVFAWPVATLLRIHQNLREEDHGKIARSDEVRAHYLARYLVDQPETGKSKGGGH